MPGELSAARTAAVPLEVKRLDQLDDLPWILGGVLALIGVLGVGYALVTAVRRARATSQCSRRWASAAAR